MGRMDTQQFVKQTASTAFRYGTGAGIVGFVGTLFLRRTLLFPTISAVTCYLSFSNIVFNWKLKLGARENNRSYPAALERIGYGRREIPGLEEAVEQYREENTITGSFLISPYFFFHPFSYKITQCEPTETAEATTVEETASKDD